MAAITTLNTTTAATKRVRTGTAQATTGQTDYVSTPSWARFMLIYFDLTAVAGTGPTWTPRILGPTPITLDTTIPTNLQMSTPNTNFTAFTGAGSLVVQLGPNVTGIADDVVNAATGVSWASYNCHLPPVIGLRITNSRGNGDETYTYTVTTFYRY